MFWIVIIVLMLLGGLGGETIKLTFGLGILAIAFRLIYGVFKWSILLTLSKVCVVILIIVVVLAVLSLLFG